MVCEVGADAGYFLKQYVESREYIIQWQNRNSMQ